MRFQDLRLRSKQWIGFGAVLIAMAGVSFFAIDQMKKLREEIDEINTYWIPGLTMISELNQDVSNLRIHQLEQVLNVKQEGDEVREQLIALIDSINANMDAYELLASDSTDLGRFDPDRKFHYTNFNDRWDDYQLAYMQLLYDPGSDEQMSQLLYEAGDTYASLSASLENLIRLNELGSAAAASRASDNFRQTRNIIILVLLITIAVSSVVAGTLIRSLTAPIRKLEAAAHAVSEGDLNARVAVENHDEIGRLSRSFNEMTASLAAAQRQLVVREKMASLGQLTAGIAHEIKNPLNFVNNFALLTKELADELKTTLQARRDDRVGDVMEPVNDLLDDLTLNTEKIAQHGARADSIVRSMLLHAHSGSGERQEIALSSFLDEHINLVSHSLRAKYSDFEASIRRDIQPDIGTFELVPQDFGRVIINMLDNAFYAVHQRAGATPDPSYRPEVTLRARRTQKGIQVDVIDNGTGIPTHLHRKIFEPFFTTKSTGEGTGLGLSLSYEIVTQGHGGTMTFESQEGVGTTMTVELPA